MNQGPPGARVTVTLKQNKEESVGKNKSQITRTQDTMSEPPTSDLHLYKEKRESFKKMSNADMTFLCVGIQGP